MNLDEMDIKTKIKLGILFGLVVFVISLLRSGSAMPDSVNLFRVKRLQEKVFLTLQTNPDAKLKYYRVLLGNRLNELEYLVDNRKYAYILTSSLRYSTTAGRMTEVITDNGLKDEVGDVSSLFKEHQVKILQLVKDYPVNEDKDWKYVQDDYNYLDIYLGFLHEVD